MKLISIIIFLSIISSSIIANQNNDSSTPETVTGSVAGSVSSKWIKIDSKVVVYIDSVEGDFKPNSIFPVIDQINRVYVPHLLPILKGTTVRFANSDSLDHNVFSPSKVKPFNIGTWGYGSHKDYTFDSIGTILLLCNIHHEMSAVILVLQNPFFTKIDSLGTYKIEGLPEGDYTLKVYHEKWHEITKEVKIKAGKTVNLDIDMILAD